MTPKVMFVFNIGSKSSILSSGVLQYSEQVMSLGCLVLHLLQPQRCFWKTI